MRRRSIKCPSREHDTRMYHPLCVIWVYEMLCLPLGNTIPHNYIIIPQKLLYKIDIQISQMILG